MFDLVGGMRGLQRRAVRKLPMMRHRRVPRAAMVTGPFVALAGVAAVAGLLLWDDRRRAAMRRRMQEVAGSVTASVSSNLHRATPPVPSGTRE
jgi:hypothetical protein